MKKECYIFDFALERALKQISDYSMKLSTNEDSPERKVADFINFLPVLAFDGAGMERISAQDVLDITYSGTSATLLAKRWQTALLVHVDNDTLKKLKENPQAMEALRNIEGFRRLYEDIETIINKSEKIKKGKEKDKKLSEKEKRVLTEEEKEMKSLRKEIQENLLKLAARIPAFMYLTDYREQCIKDVITQIEPDLFKKVTGLNVNDFEVLCSIGLFDPEKMNQGIFGFRRYENSSLNYTGIDKHANEDIGGWDTVLTRQEYNDLYAKQQSSMTDFVDLMVTQPSEKITDKKAEKVTVKMPTPTTGDMKDMTRAEISDWEKALEQIQSGTTVFHKSFGKGTVMSFKQGMKKIQIQFSVGTKVFIFPDAFIKGFLKVED